ncbi:hypothetical protein QA639_03475 [Bradyrhizobium pachyrhizi]|uniref:hypothetical protein n=1 Tax=Bradyrhizobium pachyrhizi TaxID=280333 RepID=UPI0024B0AF2E|nr:hypothetical protein [Bradyrhizobium pachyrhizi]WFU56608.1 hypothetical protein QA639_03475 [Bradyrhizobium pachyrhizi]
MKMFALAGALCLLLTSSTVCKANSGPWCKPDVVTLTFKNQQGGDLARIELRTLKAVCDRNPEKKGFGVGLERSMRIEHNGQWTDVPKECLSVFAFGVDEVSLSGDDRGLGIAIIGKPTERDESLKVSIFKHGDEVFCSQVVRCSNLDDPPDYIRECSRDLR